MSFTNNPTCWAYDYEECIEALFDLDSYTPGLYDMYSVCYDGIWLTLSEPDNTNDYEGVAQITCFNRDDCVDNVDEDFPCKDTKGFNLILNNVEKLGGGYELKTQSFWFIKAVDNEGGYKEDIDLDFDYTSSEIDVDVDSI